MARKGRGSDLAGLAALGALGYMLSKGSKAAPTGGSGGEKMPTPAVEAPLITDDMRRRAKEEGEKISEGERISSMSASKPADKPNVASSASTVKPASTAKPSAETGYLKNPGAVSPSVGNQRGPTAEELAAYEASRNVNYGNESRRTPMGSSPAAKPSLDVQGMNQRASKALSDDPLALAGAATGAGTAAYRAYKAGKSAYDANRAAKAAEQAAAVGRESVTNPLAWMAGPKNASKFTGEVPAAGREAVTNPMAWMAGPKGMAQMNEAAPSMATRAREAAEAAAARFRKKPLSEADTTGGAGRYGYKKGGAVKKKMASGGMTGSASKRADGIASKGKTRGKIC